jgi:hypothetical protein
VAGASLEPTGTPDAVAFGGTAASVLLADAR